MFYRQKLCVFLYPHLLIKSKTCAYIRHLLQNVEWNLVDCKALDYRFYSQMWVEGICFRMQNEIQQMVKLQPIDFIRKAGRKKKQSICLYRAHSRTKIIYSVAQLGSSNRQTLSYRYPKFSYKHLSKLQQMKHGQILISCKLNIQNLHKCNYFIIQ